MERIRVKSLHLQSETYTGYVRQLYQQVDWSDRLIGVLGARGTGKTTLLLQRLKLSHKNPDTALYISMDDIYFSTHTLIEFAETFRMQGGKTLFIDEVHKYPSYVPFLNDNANRYRQTNEFT